MANNIRIALHHTLRWLQARPDWQIMLLLVVVTVLWRVYMLSIYPIPIATILDERVNMLGAKTFSIGRLTNPPLLFPSSLLELYALPEPTRMMKYQPAMSGFMALGIVAFGHAYWGVVLCMALAIAASYWAIASWTNKRIGFGAALIILLLFRAPHYWMNGYFGGGPLFLASFLMLGSYARVFFHHQYRYVVCGMCGVSLALLSRPVEGGALMLCLAISGIFTLYHWFNGEQRSAFFKKAVLPILFMSLLYGGWQMYYNLRITGDPLKLPYLLYTEKYDTQRLFTFSAPSDVKPSDHYALRSLQDFDARYYPEKKQRPFSLFLRAFREMITLDRLSVIFTMNYAIRSGFLVLLHLPLLLLLINVLENAYQRQRLLPLYLSWICLWSVFMVTCPSMPHYLAAYFVVIVLLMAVYIHDLRIHYFIGLPLTVLCFTALIKTNANIQFPSKPDNNAILRNRLSSMQGNHLVFIRSKCNLFVFNEPDIDHARVVWAWDRGKDNNQPLIDYAQGRKVWCVRPQFRCIIKPYQQCYPDEKDSPTLPVE